MCTEGDERDSEKRKEQSCRGEEAPHSDRDGNVIDRYTPEMEQKDEEHRDA